MLPAPVGRTAAGLCVPCLSVGPEPDGAVTVCVRSADEFCRGYPHSLLPTPGYWVECAGQPLDEHVIWDADEGDVSEDQDAELEPPPAGKCNQIVQVSLQVKLFFSTGSSA